MSNSKKPTLAPNSPWQRLLDQKNQRQSYTKFGSQPKTKTPVPRFMPKGRSGSK